MIYTALTLLFALPLLAAAYAWTENQAQEFAYKGGRSTNNENCNFRGGLQTMENCNL
jgi:hypothetical protein